jgi:hypothetical protein
LLLSRWGINGARRVPKMAPEQISGQECPVAHQLSPVEETTDMAASSVKQEILDQLSLLDVEQQQRLLDYARSLTARTLRGVPGKDLLRFGGTIDAEDLKLMERAIEEDCERIDPNEW